MMKKLLFVSLSLIVLSSVSKAQLTATQTPVVDTINYYYLKYFYKTGGKPLPYTAAPALNNVSHMGSKFENKDTLTITGLEAFSGIASLRKSQLTMPVTLYLCNLDANGMPSLPAIDSVKCIVTSTTTTRIGGEFPDGRKWTLFKDFAVLMRNMSTHSGDSVQMCRTASRTYTAWAAVNGPTWRDKYSDGMGVVRYLGKFYSTTNFTVSGFGNTTDYEFLVAPRVTYNLNASHIMPQAVIDQANVCTWDVLTFTNTSSWRYTNRFYNFIEFYARWNTPGAEFFYLDAPLSGYPTDSSITWFFRDQDNGMNYPDPRVCIPRGGTTNTVSHYSDSTGCFVDCNFIARLRPMSIYQARYLGNQLQTAEQFTVCYDFCGDDAVGIKTNKAADGVKLYPNPAVAGKTYVSGLEGSNTVLVYDILGQVIYRESTEKDRVLVDLSKQPNGYYVVKVVSDNNKVKTVKIVKQD